MPNDVKAKLLLTRAKQLRKNQSDAEKLLWYYLRDRRLIGFKFKRQVVIGNYIVDFICVEKRLIIEADGGQHADQENYDNHRTEFLKSQGFHVLRFWNNDVLRNSEYVFNLIYEALISPHPNPLP